MNSKRKKQNFFSLAEAIDLYLQENKLDFRLKEYKVKSEWHLIVGKTIAEQTSNVWFKDGVCFVRIENPSWRYEIGFAKERLKQRINEFVGENICYSVNVL